MYIKVKLPVVSVRVIAEGGMGWTEIRPVFRPKFGTGFTPEFIPEEGQILPRPLTVNPTTVLVGIGNVRMALATESEDSEPLIVSGRLRGSAAVLAQYSQFATT